MADKFKFDVVIGNPPYQEETKDTRSLSAISAPCSTFPLCFCLTDREYY